MILCNKRMYSAQNDWQIWWRLQGENPVHFVFFFAALFLSRSLSSTVWGMDNKTHLIYISNGFRMSQIPYSVECIDGIFIFPTFAQVKRRTHECDLYVSVCVFPIMKLNSWSGWGQRFYIVRAPHSQSLSFFICVCVCEKQREKNGICSVVWMNEWMTVEEQSVHVELKSKQLSRALIKIVIHVGDMRA